MEKAKILIVEDEAIIAMEVESQLQSLGYEVTSVVDTGEKAIKKAETDKPDLILMDIRIKGKMDGIDTAEVIQKQFEIPIIFITAFADEKEVDRAKNTLPLAYLLKPIQYRELKVATELALHVAKNNRKRKEAVAALQKSEQKLRLHFDQTPLAVIEWDLDFRVTLWNPAASAIFGYDASEAIGQYGVGLIISKNESEPTEAIRQKLLKNKGGERNTNQNITKSGKTITCEWYNTPLVDQEGNVIGVASLAHDITARVKAERELLVANTQLEALTNQLKDENLYLKEEINQTHNIGNIIGQNNQFRKVLGLSEKVASTPTTVLILGETGTGKELLARAIHELSDRKQYPLVKVNCAALPANLIESELFGYEKGAFTGATTSKKGRFDLAHHGTIFLDEIGDLPLGLQTKLLRVLQEGEFEKLGGTATIKVDVRVIAATNQDLESLCADGKFRTDLFYRLNVFPIESPPLRQRLDDIPILVNHFVSKFNLKIGKNIEYVSDKIIAMLQSYEWPGNIRELENVIERAMIISSGPQLIIGDWLVKQLKTNTNTSVKPLDEVQKEHIVSTLQMTHGKVSGDSGAAKLLGLKPTTLFSRMQKFGIKIDKNIY